MSSSLSEIDELKRDLDAARAKVALLTSSEGLSAFTSLVDEVRRFLASVEAKDLNSVSSLASADSSGSVGSNASSDSTAAASAAVSSSSSSLSWSELSGAVTTIQQRVDAINALGLLESSPSSRRKKVKGSRVRRRSGRLADDDLKTALSGGSSGGSGATSGLAVGVSADVDDDEHSESQSQSQSQFDQPASSSASSAATAAAAATATAAADDVAAAAPKLRSWKLRSTETGLALRKSSHSFRDAATSAAPPPSLATQSSSPNNANELALPNNIARRSSSDRYGDTDGARTRPGGGSPVRSVPASPALSRLHDAPDSPSSSASSTPYASRIVRPTSSDELKRAIEEKYGSSGVAVPSSFGKSEEFKRAIEERYGSTGAGAAAANAALLLTAFVDIDDEDEPSSSQQSDGDASLQRRALMSRLRRSSSSSIASPQVATDQLRASATKGAVEPKERYFGYVLTKRTE